MSAAAQSFQVSYDLGHTPGMAANAADVLAYGNRAQDAFGRTVRTADLNGDGLADVIVGAAGADVGSPARFDAGAVYVWFGKEALGGVKDVSGSLGAEPDLTIWGASASDQTVVGVSLTVADVNGDGVSDLLIGASSADGPGDSRNNAGEVYVILGRPSFPAVLDLAVAGEGGADVTIYGASADDNLSSTGGLTGADVNGDGIADLLLVAPLADGPAETRTSAGEAYIIYGRDTFPTTLDLSIVGSGGADVTIHGATTGDFLGNGGDLASGDVNDDEIADLLLGAVNADGPAEARNTAGEVYVIFGRASFPATLNLAVQGDGGADVTIYGAAAGDSLSSGGALAARDIDGDDNNDLVLGAASGDGPGDSRPNAGEAYVVKGRASFPATLDLSLSGNLGADLTIYGATASDGLTSGGGLAFGDFNRDGLTDILITAPQADGPAEMRNSAGEAYIIFGHPLTTASRDLALPGSGGADVTVYGATGGDNLGIGRTLTAADVNADDFADLILGAPLGDGPEEARLSAGEAYLIRGRALFPPVIDLHQSGNLGANVTLQGATAGDQVTSGGALASADLNGDGIADLVMGASGADGPEEGRFGGGEVYVLYGIAAPEIEVAQLSTDLADGGSKAFGTLGVDVTKRLVFTIKNTGSVKLTGLTTTINGPDASLFTIIGAPVAPVLPEGSTTVTVAFTPDSTGPKEAVLHIESNDDDESPFDITLTGTAVIPIPPVTETLAADLIDITSANLNATVNAVGSEREVVFDYGTTSDYGATVAADPATINGDVSTPVHAALTGLQSRTLYHFRVRASGDLGAAAGEDMTFVTPNRVPVAVSDSIALLPEATVTLDVLANDTDADGDALQLIQFTRPSWKEGRLERAGNALVFTASKHFDGTSFTYKVADGYGGEATGIVHLTLGSCSITPATMSISAAGGTYPIEVTATGAWSVHEKRSWIQVAPGSGTNAGTVLVTVLSHTSHNVRKETLSIGGRVHTITQLGFRAHEHAKLPSELANTYQGLAERHGVLNANLGSRFELSVSSKGSFTGKWITGDSSQSLKGILVPHPDLLIWESQTTIANGRLRVELTLDEETQALTGRLSDGGANEVFFEGFNNPWDSHGKRASAFAASYVFTLGQPNPDPRLPQGSGFGGFTIQEKTGSLNIAGKLSDNTSFTSSTFVGRDGQVLLYEPLDATDGSFIGILLVNRANTPANNTVSGTSSWYSPKAIPGSRKTAYRPGFGPIPLSVSGGATGSDYCR